jgi:RNA polymerase sigma-70 factor (ECF subfamily)
MDPSTADSTALLRRWREGEPSAAPQLYHRYVRELVRLADRHLSRKVARRADGEDVVQSVFRTFFRRSARGEFVIDDTNQLWRLLVTLTLRKARATARFHCAARRSVGAELPRPIEDEWDPGVFARQPDPAEAVAVVDEIEATLQGLPAVHAHVLEQRLQGASVADIAAQLGLARQSVYRIVNVLQHRLRQRAGDAG